MIIHICILASFPMLTIHQCACMEHYQLEGIKTRLLFGNYSPLHKLVCLSKIAFVETILPYLRGRGREGEREREREREGRGKVSYTCKALLVQAEEHFYAFIGPPSYTCTPAHSNLLT